LKFKVDYHIYELQNRHKREGALLRVEFEDESIGYADCHPWSELGDHHLNEQLNRLKMKGPTNLARCSLHFARIDAQARKDKIELLSDKNIPKSHYLASDFLEWCESDVKRIQAYGYTHIKFKVGRQVDKEIAILNKLFSNSQLKLRLDFNEMLSYDQFRSYITKIEVLKPSIDFIEDPFPFQFNEKQWEKIQNEGWFLACDRQAALAVHFPYAAEVIVIKPAIQAESEWKNWTGQRKVVTSYLDHPFGQLTAAYAASLIDPHATEVHGLLSHHTYVPNPFSQKLADLGPAFKVPDGHGFGFESELAKLQWKTL